jgi:hypothetical protein
MQSSLQAARRLTLITLHMDTRYHVYQVYQSVFYLNERIHKSFHSFNSTSFSCCYRLLLLVIKTFYWYLRLFLLQWENSIFYSLRRVQILNSQSSLCAMHLSQRYEHFVLCFYYFGYGLWYCK